ncbi:amino acid adenylation domain-containing protein [Streptomyces sp. NPDC059396]|uniref:amino acid adenylation domain-containing protein n=1 Tax=Streptomyces sp. NPDC059396 TaxID=3346819 RepID=UPI0036A9E33E
MDRAAAVPDRAVPRSLAGSVLAQARRTPSATAIVDGDRQIDYAELDGHSAAVAHALRSEGVRPGQAVAVCLPRSWSLVCVMLGILRAGATVVPLDAQSPPARQRHILEDSASVALVHDTEPPDGLAPTVLSLAADTLLGAGAEGHVVRYEERGRGPYGQPQAGPYKQAVRYEEPAPEPYEQAGPYEQPQPEPGGASACSFLFYTSGTTGRPKGVEVLDAGILRLARPGYTQSGRTTPTGGARYACLANPAFDALSFEVWVPLLTGGCCVILGDAEVQTPRLLAAALERERVDTLFVTTALFNAVVDEVPDCFATVDRVLIGGEQLNAPLIRRWYRDNPTGTTRLHNVYGPTESTTFALCHPIPRGFDADVVPIGGPLPGTEALLVVDGTRAAGPGEVAELHLAGEGLAAGYRNLPEETARRFVRLPWYEDGDRVWYRTGDLVRRDDAGFITYVGRADRQVKVRGFRIEPGEIERHILSHPAVRQAYVCTRRDAAGANELLAYLVPRDELSFDDFDRHLTAGLPVYMRPHRMYLTDALPLNANGKVDQDTLLSSGVEPWRRLANSPGEGEPVSAWQREVLDLAAGVLGVPDLRPDDRWIPQGGDSLKALRLRHEVSRRWDRDLPQSLVLRADFAALAAAIAEGRRQGPQGAGYPAAPVASAARSAPATSEQQRLWLLQQRDPGSRAYNVPLAFRLHGALDTGALREALRRLVARHPALRTSFRARPEGLRQEVGEPYDPWIAAPDPRDARPEAAPAAGGPGSSDGPGGSAGRFLFDMPFDLAEPRMLQASWLPDPEGSNGILLLHLHHIAVDGWSLTVLFQDLSAYYRAALYGEESGPPDDADTAPTPLDFADWQADWLGRAPYLDQRTALKEHYAGRPAVSPPLLPVRPVRPPDRPAGRLLRTSLGQHHRTALDRLGAELGLTRFQLLLSVFAWSLYGVTGDARPLIATPVANRPLREFESSVGMFANTALVPLELGPGEDLRAQLARQGAEARAVLDRQDVVLADVLADHRFRTDGPPFDFLFVLENTEFGALALPGCEIRPEWPEPAEAKCPLTLSVVEHESGFDCLWEYADDHFDRAGAEAAALLFRQGIDRLADGRPATLTELIAPYRRGLADPGRGPSVPLSFTTVAEGFARQVRRTPDAPAVTAEGRTLSYAELDAQAEALAAVLRARHPVSLDDGSPARVALHLPPSPEHVVALLALARLNLTAVPLDPAYPPALLRRILDQARPLCVLVPPGGEDVLDAPDAADASDDLPRYAVTLAAVVPSAPTPVAPRPLHEGRRPLYTLFTSGSTGTPKGVDVPDRTLCNLLEWQSGAGGLAGPAVTQQFSMLSFDVSFQEIFTTLCGGGHLHLVRPGWRHDVPALLEQLETAGVERLFMPFVALQLLAEHGVRLGRHPSRLREVITAGEQLVCTDAIRRWFAGMPGARLFNHYGPTETHVVSGLCLEGDPARWPARPAIGRPVGGAWLRVVDEAGEAVPPGRTGQLMIGGTMVAPCYLGDEELNRTRFVELPGAGTGQPGAGSGPEQEVVPGVVRFYRSGDLARFDRQGLLHYMGRDDEQIKVSGHRLELGQVEAALLEHPRIVNAVVTRDGEDLVACLECRDPGPTAQEMAEHLAPLLPSFVRIHRFRRIRSLPRTPSGKMDRRAVLTAPGEELEAYGPDEPVLSAGEARLAGLFEAVTGKRVGPEQRFFDAGATSLDLMRFHLRCTTELGVAFTIADLFEHVTVRGLARFLEGPAPSDPVSDPTSVSVSGAASGAVSETESVSAAGGSVGPTGSPDEPIAVVGMAVRLPGARDLAAFWDLVRTGGSGIEHFEAAEGLVGARSQMDGLLSFDPGRFGISPHEARLMDPQQRHLLMSCVEALAHAGIATPEGDADGDGERVARVGLVASCGENTYYRAMLREADAADLPDDFQLALHHDKDFLATKAAYHLGLTGPAFTVQAACASSLVAVHVAAGMLRKGDADVMLAGGVLVDTDLSEGYRYRPQHIFSPDGHCRPFSDDAEGTIGASGVGVVVLKPLRLAERDGDTVYAVITGSALNNDGADKLGYSAPSLAGQREVIRSALRRSGRTGSEVGYVEAHGTATRLGDPVEFAALRQAFATTGPAARCALSSVKSQLGHLGAAAGVIGLIRATLALHHAQIPPTLGFRRLNPQIGEDATPFYIPERSLPWPEDRERVAAISSFGIGGTNAHVILESVGAGAGGAGRVGRGTHGASAGNRYGSGGPAARPGAGRPDDRSGSANPDNSGVPGRLSSSEADVGEPDGHSGLGTPGAIPCLVLSSSSPAGLRADADRIADYLAARPEAYAQVLRHLQAGRPAHRWRAAAECADAGAAVAWLRTVAGGVTPVPNGQTEQPAPDEPGLGAAGRTARELAVAWASGRTVRWPAGTAQAPWDFPPPAFELADYDFPRAAPNRAPDATTPQRLPDATTPQRLPEDKWLHQPHWVRLRRATSRTPDRTPTPPPARTLVTLTAGPSPSAAWQPFERTHARVIRVSAADRFARLADDSYEVDPADPTSLRLLLTALTSADAPPSGIDWLHALPLAVDGEADEDTLARAQWACLDTPAALLRAIAETPELLPRPRLWWLSYGAQPVVGFVQRPALGLLAGVGEVARQETGAESHWLDLPSPGPTASDPTAFGPTALDPTAPATANSAPAPATWAPPLAALLAEDGTALPHRLALRQNYWWHQTVQPVASPVADTVSPPEAQRDPVAQPAQPVQSARATHLILGGTGGIGTAIAALLLEQTASDVVLLARRPYLPSQLTQWADRVTLIEADLAQDALDTVLARVAPYLGRLESVVHAAGTAAGSLILRREPDAMRRAMAAKMRGALLVERLIAGHSPAYAVYCSSMSVLFGGVGQFDYAAAAGLLDGFARHQAGPDESTVRIGIDWDVWREVGMAGSALRTDARHRAHLATGLSTEEGRRLYAQALRLQLPQLMVSTVSVDEAHVFYEPPATASIESVRETASPADQLADSLRRRLGVDELDPAASLYDLGADSLTLLDLISEVKRLYGVDLELFELSHQVSLNEVLSRLEQEPEVNSGDADPVPLDIWQTGTGHDLVCLVHPVGGDIQAYRALVSALDPGPTVCLIADPALRHTDPGRRPDPGHSGPRHPGPGHPGLGDTSHPGPNHPGLGHPGLRDTGHPGVHHADPSPWTLAERARQYHAALQARFPHGTWRWRLAGWSFGAWVAQAMAAEAEAAGRPADALYLLDPPPPDAGPRLGGYDERQLQEVFARELNQNASGDPLGEGPQTYANRLAQCCQTNLTSMRDHRPPRLTRTPSTLWLAARSVPGLPTPEPPEAQLRAWRTHLPEPVEGHVVDTTHYGLVQPPYVKDVADAINAAAPRQTPATD